VIKGIITILLSYAEFAIYRHHRSMMDSICHKASLQIAWYIPPQGNEC
jgi:hypothetical protein